MFRAPILLKRVKPVVTCWEKPVTIARHAYGDLYKAVEYRVPGAGKAELVFTDENGRELSRQTVFDFKGPGVVQAMHNRDASILSFRPLLLHLCPVRGAGRVVRRKGHHLQGLRPDLQAAVPESL